MSEQVVVAPSSASSRIKPPSSVRAATVWWVTAVAAGAVEAVGRVAVSAADGEALSSLMVGIGVRVTIYGAVLLVVAAFWRGYRSARIALALGLGIVGMLSLVIEPLSWLADGNSLGDALGSADLALALVIAVRAVHIAAVVVACVLMFRPESNRYFALARRASGRSASGTAASVGAASGGAASGGDASVRSAR
ncbi:hypothetical protein [Cryptosporangium minutisporangium]|uniref:Uncharacterized protein n=1 Tax=Cryptosporangium minutisporangium TaxID=113569 RepID=A0ABP6SY84_9ACTN